MTSCSNCSPNKEKNCSISLFGKLVFKSEKKSRTTATLLPFVLFFVLFFLFCFGFWVVEGRFECLLVWVCGCVFLGVW